MTSPEPEGAPKPETMKRARQLVPGYLHLPSLVTRVALALEEAVRGEQERHHALGAWVNCRRCRQYYQDDENAAMEISRQESEITEVNVRAEQAAGQCETVTRECFALQEKLRAAEAAVESSQCMYLGAQEAVSHLTVCADTWAETCRTLEDQVESLTKELEHRQWEAVTANNERDATMAALGSARAEATKAERGRCARIAEENVGSVIAPLIRGESAVGFSSSPEDSVQAIHPTSPTDATGGRSLRERNYAEVATRVAADSPVIHSSPTPPTSPPTEEPCRGHLCSLCGITHYCEGVCGQPVPTPEPPREAEKEPR